MAEPTKIKIAKDGTERHWYAGAWRSQEAIDRRRKRDLATKQEPYYVRHRLKWRMAVLAFFGEKCAHCGYDTDWRALQIDHINGGGHQERQEMGTGVGYYKHILKMEGEGYQLLCANCNWIKRYEEGEHGRANHN